MSHPVFRFFNNHFEPIILFNVLVIMVVVGMGIFEQAVALSLRTRWKTVRGRLLFLILTAFQVAMVIIFVVLAVMNYRPKPKLDFSARVEADTRWVKDPLKLFFVTGSRWLSICASGDQRQVEAVLPEEIRRYQFSPTGRRVVFVAREGLYLFDRPSKALKRMDTLTVKAEGMPGRGPEGAYEGFAWSPDSRRLLYRRSQWSDVASQSAWRIYDVDSGRMKTVESRGEKFSELVWGREGEALYGIGFESRDTTEAANPFFVKVYRFQPPKWRGELIVRFPFDQPVIPDENLALRGIHLFRSGAQRIFPSIEGFENPVISARGQKIGIDEWERLYYVPHRWWKVLLYEVPRFPEDDPLRPRRFWNSPWAVQNLRWFPSGRYVMMEHFFLGTLILDPSQGRMGLLETVGGSSWGWPSEPEFCEDGGEERR